MSMRPSASHVCLETTPLETNPGTNFKTCCATATLGWKREGFHRNWLIVTLSLRKMPNQTLHPTAARHVSCHRHRTLRRPIRCGRLRPAAVGELCVRHEYSTIAMRPLRTSALLVLGTTLSGITFGAVRSQCRGVPPTTSDLLIALVLGAAVGFFVFGSAAFVIFANKRLNSAAKRKLGVAGLASLFFLALCRLAIPCSLNGSWVGPRMTAHLCDSHCFIQFADSRATNYHAGTWPTDWGSYTKAGWNTYAWQIPGNKKPITLHVGWLLLRGEAEEAGIPPRFWGWRDWQFRDCARVVRESQALPPKPEKARAKHE